MFTSWKWLWLPALLGLGLAAQSTRSSAAGATPSAAGYGFIAGFHPRGATLHGQNLLAGTAVLAGEQVATGARGSATLISTDDRSGVLQMARNSEVVAGRHALHLKQGRLQAQGWTPVATCALIEQPLTADAVVQITAHGCLSSGVRQIAGRSRITYLHGQAGAARPKAQTTLQAGQGLHDSAGRVQAAAIAPAVARLPTPAHHHPHPVTSQSH